MKINCKELAEYSFGEATIEGRLHHKRINGNFSHSGFKEKWFKLRANVLFYFNANETGKLYDKKPAGAFVLENAVIQYEMNSEAPFSFSLFFHDELDKKHLFAGRTEEYINQWVNVLKQASYEFWRTQLIALQTKLCTLTGKDPLLMYPRNEGSSSSETSKKVDVIQKSNQTSSSFRSYIVSDGEVQSNRFPNEELRSDKPGYVLKEELNQLSDSNFFNEMDRLRSEINSIQIDPPPIRPARTNKLKKNNSSPNLIEL